MKNLILSCALACAAIVGSIDQTFAQTNKIRFGIKAGIDFMTLGTSMGSGGVSGVSNIRPGFQGGVYADIPLSSTVSIMPNFLYTQKGGNSTGVISGHDAELRRQVNYIDIPLLVGVKFNPDFTIFIGPQLSLLSSQKTVANVTGLGSETSTDTYGLRKTILAGNVGVTYNVNRNFGMNFNFMTDFQYTVDEKVANTADRNRGFAITLNYLF